MATGDRTVLVLDDGAFGSTGLYQRLLEQATEPAYRVITDRSNGPILDLCRAYSVAGILLASPAPNSRGADLLTHLKAQLGGSCPPIIVVGDNDANLARQAFKAGAADYLVRDQVTADTLCQALNDAIPGVGGVAALDPTAALSSADCYRDLVESLDEGFCICEMLLDQEGTPVDYRFLEVNAVFESLTGLQQPVGKTARELVPGLEEIWFETYNRVALDYQPIRFEQQSVPMQRWFDVYAFPMGKPQHHLFGILFRNITLRKIVEQEQEKFFAVGSDLQAITGDDGYFRWVSPSFERLLGWTVAELTARPWTEFVHPDDVNSTVLEAETLFSGQETFNFENRYRHKDGSYRWLLWRAQPDSAKQVIYGVAVDITDRKQVEERLQQRETELSLVTNAVPSLISFIDSEQRYRFNNHTYEDWFGQPVAQTYGKHMREVLGEAAYAAVYPYVEQVLAGQQVTFETEVPYKDSGTRYIHATYVPRFSEAGAVEGFVGTALDITDRKLAEVALREREQRLDLATQAAKLGVFEWDVQSDCAFWENSQMYNIFGHTREDGALSHAQFVNDVIHPNDREAFERCLAEGIKNERFHAICRIRRRSDSRWRWVEFIGQFELAAAGTPLRLVGVLSDISDRKRSEAKRQQAEEKLRTNAERLSLALTAAKLGDWSWDVATDMVTFSEQAADMFGIPPGPHMSWTQMQNLIHPDDRERVRLQVEQAIVNHSDYDIEYLVMRADGQSRWVAAKGRAQYDSSGQVLGMLGVLQDITSRKQTEQEREQLLASERTARAQAEAANRIKDEFLAVVSHELRSPLNPILGWSRLLSQGQLNAQKTQYALDVIERNAQMQAQLINDLLDVSRILRGKLSLDKKAVNLAVVVRTALETVQLAAEAKSIQIHTVLEPDLGTVSGDLDRLQQVVWNLLSNAVKFTPEGKRIEVRLKQIGSDQLNNSVDRQPSALPQTYAQLTISDTGKGIHPDFLPHVFDRFRQESTTTTRQFGGLGLGLALVRYLVELHGGRVQAYSPGEGQGATFTVQLPLLAQNAAADQEVKGPKPSTDLTNVQILVVDDDASTLEFIAFLLELNGARVVAANSVDDALAELAQFTPDILLSDIGMPERDGYMLMRQVRRLPPEQGGQIPAIALTAYAGEIDYQQAMAAGFQKHISKPVEPDYLIRAIADLLNRS